jgi:hypothetical protein
MLLSRTRRPKFTNNLVRQAAHCSTRSLQMWMGNRGRRTGLTLFDTANMGLMTRLGIRRCLTFEHHFLQAGSIAVPPFYPSESKQKLCSHAPPTPISHPYIFKHFPRTLCFRLTLPAVGVLNQEVQMAVCSTCKGKGLVTCPQCNGTGLVPTGDILRGLMNYGDDRNICPECGERDSRGRLVSFRRDLGGKGEITCPRCKGTGEEP